MTGHNRSIFCCTLAILIRKWKFLLRSFQDQSISRLTTPLGDDSIGSLTPDLQEVSDEDVESIEEDVKIDSISVAETPSTKPLYHLEDIDDVDLSIQQCEIEGEEPKQTDKDTIHLFYVISHGFVNHRTPCYSMEISRLS